MKRAEIGVERYLEIRSAYHPTFGYDQALFFLYNVTGTPQVWRQDADTPWPKQISFFPERVLGLSANPKRDLLRVSLDAGGNERSQIYLMDGEGLNVKDITGDPAHIYQAGSWSHDGSLLSYATNKRNGVYFDVYVYDVETAEHRLVHESDATNYALGFTPDDRHVIVSRHHESLHNDLYLVDIATGELTHLTPHEGVARFSARFTRDGKQLFLITDLDNQFMRLSVVHQETGERNWLTDDDWDVTGVSMDIHNRYVAYTRNVDGNTELTVLERNESGVLRELDDLPDLPAGVFGVHWDRDGRRLAISHSGPRSGNEIWLLDIVTRDLRRTTYASISGVPQHTFVEAELIHYPTFDGRQIPALYYKPSHKEGPYPTVIDVHGGPESQSVNSFAGLTQYFVERGFAVLKTNVRGSAGYGRDYLHLDDVRKRMDSVADLAHAVDWLVESGQARRDAVAVMGGSYGGFMVLAAVTHYPTLFAAGVDIVGIANLRTFMENTSAYRRHLRESEYGTIADDGEFFDEISPIHHVDKIQAPMFIVHGANDPRVPVDEAEQMVSALRTRNHPVEYLRFEDEGHGLAKLANRIEAYTKIVQFLEEKLPL
ncbi:S9 family peptidase [Alicyclobacillus fodiniaquatilis]|uniref:Acyl-peptide hydrolase n=1 Tax=Alicyclobacillus fodiniaquatilis TaxID=1661150 RepID=A0ABW4JFK3_9BACL